MEVVVEYPLLEVHTVNHFERRRAVVVRIEAVLVEYLKCSEV